jgi:hypothetical protein
MEGSMACAICELRKPRRYCPGVRGDICSLCCGNEREQTVSCPLSCEYLREARMREKLPEVDPKAVPNLDIKITERFLAENEPVLIFVAGTLAAAALGSNMQHEVIDFDVREALEALIKTYRTRESGLFYDTRPANPIAGALYADLMQNIEAFQQDLAKRGGVGSVRDVTILGMLVFLQRLEFQHNNGRRRGRAFLDFLRQQFPSKPAEPAPSLLHP